ncbi:MAG: serine hydrolase, partial [Sediminibacterium sp.]|nr:serine hydrolase [Sediminibacterium sp.]
QINRDKNNIPSFTDYTFNVDKKNYFYPASTVKMPLAFLALEKLNDLHINGLNKASTMLTLESKNANIAPTYFNARACDGRPTIEEYIKEIFLVSDNDAYNRLYEFLGQETIQKKLNEKGYPDVAIRHRLNEARTAEQNKYTNEIKFIDSIGNKIYIQQEQYSNAPMPIYNEFVGNGYYKNDSIIYQPLNFSNKNRIYLSDLHHMLKSVIFDNVTSKEKKFNLTNDDRTFLLKYMHLDPTKSICPNYDTVNYWANYCKFLYYGSQKTKPDSNIIIFNKVGDAYGFLTDVAYIIDTNKKIEFMLSATIYCNEDGILNDDKYDYDTIGFPFLQKLGQLIYIYENSRDK